MKYLFAEPQLSSTSLLLLADAVVRGDRKWDNLRLHPHSLPGRYISTLDLSHLSDSYFAPHITAVSRACGAMLPLLPNIAHLKLPPGQLPFSLNELRSAPFAGKLRALEGLQVVEEVDLRGRDPIVHLLIAMPRLEVLGVTGPGMQGSAPREEYEQSSLSLPLLHTLTLDGVKSSILLSNLLRCELPSLRKLLLTSYNGCHGDQTYEFQEVHGAGLLSLTYLPTREWPTIHPTPPLNTLDLHPKLKHLSILLPNSVLQPNRDLAASLARPNHPLSAITLPKWTNVARASPSPSPVLIPSPLPGTPSLTSLSVRDDHSRRTKCFLTELLDHKPPQLSCITADGFTWISPSLGRAALEAGASGEMRVWAQRLREHGVELRDGEGNTPPVVVQRRTAEGGERARGRRMSRVEVGRSGGRRVREDEDGA
jgi:hypothetical protein